MGSYFGFALLLANYSKEIWKNFNNLLEKDFGKYKKVTEKSFHIILFGMGSVVILFKNILRV